MSGGLASAVVDALSALPQWALALSELFGCLPALAFVVRIVWLANLEGPRRWGVAPLPVASAAILALEAWLCSEARLPTAPLLLLDVALFLPVLTWMTDLDAWRALYLCALATLLTSDLSLPAVLVDAAVAGNNLSELFLAWPGLLVQWALWGLLAPFLWRRACPQLARFLTSQFVTPGNWHTLWMVPVLLSASFSFARPYPSDSPSIRDSIIASAILWISLNLLFLLAFRQVASLIQMASHSLRTEREQGQTNLQNEQMSHLAERIGEARRQRHDLRHHLNALAVLADKGDLDGMRAYLGELSEVVRLGDAPIEYCENGVLNAALVYFADRARAAGAEVDISTRIPSSLPQRETMVASVLANLLENAVAGIQDFAAVREERPLLRVRAELRGRDLFLVIDNSCAPELVRQERGTFRTTKGAHHGLGIASVRAAARESDGVASFEVEGETFRASVMLGGGRPHARGER